MGYKKADEIGTLAWPCRRGKQGKMGSLPQRGRKGTIWTFHGGVFRNEWFRKEKK